jgi:hypothetical protein
MYNDGGISMKKYVPFVALVVILAGIGSVPVIKAETRPNPPTDSFRIAITAEQMNVLTNLEKRLDTTTNHGTLKTVSVLAQQKIYDTRDGTITSDVRFLGSNETLSSINSQAYAKDISDVSNLLQMAEKFQSPDALNYSDELVAEILFACGSKNGRYYGVSHLEGHGQEIDNFISM